MARAVRRWLVAGVLACCALAVALLPPREPRIRYRVVYGDGYGIPAVRLNRERLRFEDALARLRLLALRDSLVLPAGAAGVRENGGRIRVVADPGIPSRVVDQIARSSERSWERTAPHDTTVSVVVVALIDTATVVEGYRRELPWVMRTTHILPTEEEHPICMHVIDFGMFEVRSLAEGESWLAGWRAASLRRGLGACAYYAAFGLPGREVGHWLESLGYLPLLNADWSGSEPGERYAWLREGSSHPAWIWDLPADLIGCAAGDRARCRRAARAGGGREGRLLVPAPITAPGIVLFGGPRTYGNSWTDGLGPATQEYLSDMVGAFGHERFARFWQSDAPVEEAFAAAMGVPLDEWTMQWARRYIGVPRTAGQLP